MPRHLLPRIALLVSVCAAAIGGQPAFAQGTGEAEDVQSDTSEGTIVVRGERLRGQLDVEQAPLLELGAEDIAAEGVTSIADLVTQLTEQSGSARGRGGGGRPVILINGIRVGSFREFSNYPPEALERVEVFPEEVAQRFGFPPDRRVMNLILKDNYRNAEVELALEGPSRGGFYRSEQELGFLQIADGARINVNLEASDNSLLTEDERDIIQTPVSVSDVAGDPDQAEFRSLVADARSLEANISWAKAFIDSGTSVSANANYTRTDRLSLRGLNTVVLTDPAGDSVLRTIGEQSPLEQRTAEDIFNTSGSLTRVVNAFRLTSTFNAGLSENTQTIDRRFDTADLQAQALAGTLPLDGALPQTVDAGVDIASQRGLSAQTLTTLRGPIARLPAGELLATFDLGYDWSNIRSSDTRNPLPVDLTRGDLSTGVNLVIPITSRRTGFADALGSFSLSTQVGLQRLSDFGTLGDYTIGLNWSPFDSLNLSATYIMREVAPGLSALGSPEIVTLNTPVFDFTNGETVLATVTSGGNPSLLAETQRDWKFAANWQLPFWSRARVNFEYVRNRSDDVTSGFPQITPEIEAAFPDRVTRNASGTLVAIDQRSVTFAETRAERLNIGLFIRGSIGAGNPQEQGARGGVARADRPTRSGPRAGGRPGGPPSPEQRAAFQQLREQVCADDGMEVLTRLVEAVQNGEDVSAIIPGMDPSRIERLLNRVRGEDGSVDPERLEQARERICSRDPASRGGAGRGGEQGTSPASGSPPPGFNPLQRRNFRGFRYFISLNHAIELDNQILIAPGLAPLDQLDGQGTGAFGLARHSSRLSAGIFGSGIGARLSAQYVGEARLDGSGQPGASDLFIDDLATFNLRVFSELGQLIGSNEGALKNTRISLRADNIFDARRRVTDESGDTPIPYQPFLIDPVGRYVGIELRKLF
ncbi:hypothetical protein [uncultured Erythrobacter sp.]|uniref:hypothetical protein n=1 Tax=uncultured Erythrobacter sp. TaxID=263913 RepID=UPI002606CB49|nr:hypothetical protein [uncultured Erythrobacter sp.]